MQKSFRNTRKTYRYRIVWCTILWKYMKGQLRNIQNWTSRLFSDAKILWRSGNTWKAYSLQFKPRHRRQTGRWSGWKYSLYVHSTYKHNIFIPLATANIACAAPVRSSSARPSDTSRKLSQRQKKETETLVLTGVTSATMSCARTRERDDNGARIISVLPIGSFRGHQSAEIATNREAISHSAQFSISRNLIPCKNYLLESRNNSCNYSLAVTFKPTDHNRWGQGNAKLQKILLE